MQSLSHPDLIDDRTLARLCEAFAAGMAGQPVRDADIRILIDWAHESVIRFTLYRLAIRGEVALSVREGEVMAALRHPRKRRYRMDNDIPLLVDPGDDADAAEVLAELVERRN